MSRAKEVDRTRPTLTEEDVLALKIGDKIRNIPGDPYEVVSIQSGKYGETVVLLAYWHERHQCWRYEARSAHELTILFTPHRMPSA